MSGTVTPPAATSLEIFGLPPLPTALQGQAVLAVSVGTSPAAPYKVSLSTLLAFVGSVAPNLSGYVTNDALATALANVATPASISAQLTPYAKSSDVAVAIAPLVTQTAFNTALSTLATTASVNAAIAAIPTTGTASLSSLGGYPVTNPQQFQTAAQVTATVQAVIGAAPAALATLAAIDTQLGNDESAASALTAQVSGKLSKASNLADVPNPVAALSVLGGYPQSNPLGFQTAAQIAAAVCANVSGVVAVANGGTGAVTPAAALVAIGAYAASNPLGFQTANQVAAAIQAVVGAAPAALATLQAIDAQLASDESAASALTTQVLGKLSKASNLSDVAAPATALANLGGYPSTNPQAFQTAAQVAALIIPPDAASIVNQGGKLVAPAILGAAYFDLRQHGGMKGDGTTDETALANFNLAKAIAAGREIIVPGNFNLIMSDAMIGGGGALGRVMMRGMGASSTITNTATTGGSFTGTISTAGVLTVTSAVTGVPVRPGQCVTAGSYRSMIATVGSAANTFNMVDFPTSAIASQTMTTAPNVISFGNGLAPNRTDTGWLRDLVIIGSRSAPNDGSMGLILDAMSGFQLSGLDISNTFAGFGFIGNDFFADMDDCQAGVYGTCQVGAYLAGIGQGNAAAAGYGNQFMIKSSRLTGTKAGIASGPSTEGLTVIGGQMGVANGGGDLCGAIVLGWDPVSGIYAATSRGTGTGSTKIDSVDMEGINNAWLIRTFGEYSLIAENNPCRATSGSPIGILKSDDCGNARVVLLNNLVQGSYSSPQAIILNGYGHGTVYEVPGNVDGTSFNNVPCAVRSLLAQSNLNHGTAMFDDYQYGETVWQAGTYTQVRNGVIYVGTSQTNTLPLAMAVQANAPVEIDGNTIVASTASPYVMNKGDLVLDFNKVSGAPSAANLPTSPYQREPYYFFDLKGDAGTNNITLNAPSGSNINGQPSFVMNSNGDSIAMIALPITGGFSWRVV